MVLLLYSIQLSKNIKPIGDERMKGSNKSSKDINFYKSTVNIKIVSENQ